MPQVAEQRTIRLRHGLALALALHRIGLADSYRDDAIKVSGDRVVEEIEVQRCLAHRRAVERQIETPQRIDKPLLGALEITPGEHVGRIGEIGDGAVQVAGGAKLRGGIVTHQPVADAMRLVGAIAQPRPRPMLIFAVEPISSRDECAYFKLVGTEPERVPALQTLHVLEIDGVAARPAFEPLHRTPRSCSDAGPMGPDSVLI